MSINYQQTILKTFAFKASADYKDRWIINGKVKAMNKNQAVNTVCMRYDLMPDDVIEIKAVYE